MRHASFALIILCVAVVVFAQENSSKSDTSELAANKVLEALKAGEAGALKSLAVANDPDPWLVVDELCRRGEHAAAKAFAEAGPRAATDMLPGYVEKRVERPVSSQDRGHLLRVEQARSAKDPVAVLAAGEPLAGELDSVPRILIAHFRGVAHFDRKEYASAEAAFVRVADAAERVGWIWRVGHARGYIGITHSRRGDHARAIESYDRALISFRAMGDATWEAWTLRGLVYQQLSLEDGPKALALQNRLLAMEADIYWPRQIAPAADLVLAAVEAGDQAALAAFAGKDSLDPWLVADELLARGRKEAALAYARAALRKDTERLPDYLATQDAAGDPVLRKTLERVVELGRAKDAEGVLEALKEADTEADSVVPVRLSYYRGWAFYSLGRYEESAKAYLDAGMRAERIGWLRKADSALSWSGSACGKTEDWEKALQAREHLLVLREAREDPAGAASVLKSIGGIHSRLGEREKAKAAYDGETALRAALMDRPGEAVALRNAAFHADLLEPDEAIPLLRRAIEIWEDLGDRPRIARALAEIAFIYMEVLCDYSRALTYTERSLAVSTESNDRSAMAHLISKIAHLYMYLGDYSKVLSHYERSLMLYEELDDGEQIVMTLLRIGLVHRNLGEYSKAQSYSEQSLLMARELEDPVLEGLCLVEQGQAYRAMLRPKRALECFEKARAVQEEFNERGENAHVLRMMGDVHESLGDLPTALGFYRRSLAILEKNDDRYHERYWMAVQLRQIGKLQSHLGELEKAWSSLERSLAVSEEIGNRREQARTLCALGNVHAARGDHRTAVRCLDRAIGLAKRIRSRETLVVALKSLARIRLDAGENALALASARQALTELETLLGGLAEGESSAGRERYADLFGIGVLAAARIEDPRAVLEFLESGRAGALLETLGGGRAAVAADLPDDLLQAEVVAKGGEAKARAEYTRALDAGDRRAIRETARGLDLAMDRRRQVAARIQREAKRVAGVFYPRAAPLEEIQGWMPEGTVLVVYGLCLEEALAVVVTPEGRSIVGLGSRGEIEAACAAVAPALEQAETRDPLREEDGAAAPTAAEGLARLRSLLVDPLEFGEEVRCVLVSPAGALGYVPWGALLDRPVACVPSGTTWVLLREEERRPGTKILALGDPKYDVKPGDRAVETYRGGRLHPLPATRQEALTVGDTVLLGAKATEAGLAEALKSEKRWRAVHLACHGLVDTERPLFSSLALTPDAEEDGFLTWLDIFRLEIPADLVVLSACETARGKVAKAEGIVGLTRAFMYAGSPRVLCSLWKVDDQATMALMVKFYELWNPEEGVGLPAATALRRAQEFVRSHEKWAHPYYWAAWVLWGLP